MTNSRLALTLAYFNRFPRAEGLTDEQHAAALQTSPCIAFVGGVVEYVGLTHGLTLKPSAVRKAVRESALRAYKISFGFHFSPADVDAWLESLRVSA